MKKILIALCFLCVGFTVQAQETEAEKQQRAMELMSKKVDMTVDTELFKSVTPNTFVSESPKAVIMAMMVPETYEGAKAKMEKDMDARFDITDKGEKTINGVKVLFMEGTSEAEGVKLNNIVYCIKHNENTCIMFIGMSETSADQKYVDAIQKAANSVIK